MKGLTICQPYAHRIAIRVKRIENRTWATSSYRGDLLIHSGKSHAWMDAEDIADYPTMVFGAAVAIARLADCVALRNLPAHRIDDPDANGPFCWLLADVRPLVSPIPCRGAQGLWYVEPTLERAVLAQVVA